MSNCFQLFFHYVLGDVYDGLGFAKYRRAKVQAGKLERRVLVYRTVELHSEVARNRKLLVSVTVKPDE